MSSPALRPQFSLPLSQPPDTAMRALEAYLDACESPIESQRAGRHMTLTVTAAVRHVWSPWLNLEFETPPPPESRLKESAAGDELATMQTSLHARFSPAPGLWTSFMAVYFSLATAGFFTLMWALAQWTMGHPPAALWGTLGCGLGCGALWWVSLIGQKLAGEQMVMLRDTVQNALAPDPDTPPQS